MMNQASLTIKGTQMSLLKMFLIFNSKQI